MKDLRYHKTNISVFLMSGKKVFSFLRVNEVNKIEKEAANNSQNTYLPG